MNLVEEFKKKVKKIVDSFREEMKGMRTGRPNTSLVEDIKVEYHGDRTPIKHLASVSISPPREIVIRVWEDDMIKKVTKAIEESDINLSPNVDDENVVRIFLPELSQERRKEIITYMHKKAEKYRIQIRKIRESFNKKVDEMLDDNEISEDDKFRLKESIQDETDNANNAIEEIIEKKEKQIKQ